MAKCNCSKLRQNQLGACSKPSVLSSAGSTLPAKNGLNIALFRVIPTMTCQDVYLDIFSIYKLSDIYFDILSGIYSDIPSDICSSLLSGGLSDIYSDILSGILSDIFSDMVSGIHFDILSAILSNILSVFFPALYLASF